MPSIFDKYYTRPDTKEFDDLCLAEFCTNFSFLSASQRPKMFNKKGCPRFMNCRKD